MGSGAGESGGREAFDARVRCPSVPCDKGAQPIWLEAWLVVAEKEEEMARCASSTLRCM